MYGTLMRAKVTPGNRDAVVALMGEGTGAKGFHATHVLFPDDDDRTVIAAVLFDDDAAYSANAHDPTTERVVRTVPRSSRTTPSGPTAAGPRSPATPS